MALMLMIWVAEALAAEALLFAALAFAVILELPRRYRAAALRASVSQPLQRRLWCLRLRTNGLSARS